MMKNTGKKVVQESLCSSLCIPVDRQKHGIAAALLHRRKRSNLVHSNLLMIYKFFLFSGQLLNLSSLPCNANSHVFRAGRDSSEDFPKVSRCYKCVPTTQESSYLVRGWCLQSRRGC